MAAALLLAACHAQPVVNQAALADAPEVDDDDHIDCAHGDAPFRRNCTVDRMESAQGLVLTVRHPDGAFHRLLVTKDGRGVIAADGAERAIVAIDGTDSIAVTIGGDRYRLPATVKAKPAAP